MENPHNETSKNILIIKLSSIGDCLLATPAIESIRKGYPNSFITWLIEDKSKDIAILNPHVNEVIVIDKKNFKIGDYLSLIKQLRKRHYDISIDLQGVDRTAIFAYLSGAKERYVEEYANLGFLSNKKIIREGRTLEHAVNFYLFLAENTGGAKLSSFKTTLLTFDEDKKFASDFLEKNFNKINVNINSGINNNNRNKNIFIGINPSGTWKTKRWPLKYFIDISKRLINEFEANIIIFGGKEDEYFADEILKEVNNHRIKSAAGKTTLKQAHELLAKMDYFITPDSGLMHIASGIEGLKTIAIFGSTDPKLTGPIGKYGIVLRDNLHCIPCFKKECPLNKIDKNELKECVLCMKRISPDRVYNIIFDDIKQKAKM